MDGVPREGWRGMGFRGEWWRRGGWVGGWAPLPPWKTGHLPSIRLRVSWPGARDADNAHKRVQGLISPLLCHGQADQPTKEPKFDIMCGVFEIWRTRLTKDKLWYRVRKISPWSSRSGGEDIIKRWRSCSVSLLDLKKKMPHSMHDLGI